MAVDTEGAGAVTAGARYQRIVLKVSGESLGSPGIQLNPLRFAETAQSIAELRDMGVCVTVVVGGGNIFRGRDSLEWDVDQDTADEVGMAATGVNAKLLSGKLRAKGVPHQIFSRGTASGSGVRYEPANMRTLLADGQVAIIAGGSGETGHSTDLPAIQAAIDTGAEVVIMSKHGVQGVHDADPKLTPYAKLLAELTASGALRANLAVMDPAALILARDNGKLIHVIGAAVPDGVRHAVEGKEIGSVIYPR
jgi:uridylate kinase